MRRWIFNLHLIVGLTAGLLVSLIGLTGSLLVFRHEIDRALYPALFHAAPVSTDFPERQITFEETIRRVSAAYPKAKIQLLLPARTPGDSDEVWLKKPQARVFVDPATGKLLGSLDPGHSPTDTLFALHTTLLEGDSGENVVGVGGLCLLFLSLSGLIVWWPKRRHNLGQHLTIKWSASAIRRNYDLHRAAGFYASVLLTLSALTGTGLAFSEPVTAALYRWTGTPQPKKPTSSAEPAAPKDIPLDRIARYAEAALPEARLIRIALPAKAGAPVVVRMRFPDELHPNGMNNLYFTPGTGRLLRIDDSRHAPPVQHLLNLRYPLHVGVWAGLVSRILLSLLGLMPALLFVTGVRMWWIRVVAKRLRAKASRESADYADASAASRSAIKSSTFSIPTE